MKRLLDATSPRLKENIPREYAKDKEVKNRAMNDKRHFIDALGTEVEEAVGRQELKTIYGITTCLNGDFGASLCQPVKVKHGRFI